MEESASASANSASSMTMSASRRSKRKRTNLDKFAIDRLGRSVYVLLWFNKTCTFSEILPINCAKFSKFTASEKLSWKKGSTFFINEDGKKVLCTILVKDSLEGNVRKFADALDKKISTYADRGEEFDTEAAMELAENMKVDEYTSDSSIDCDHDDVENDPSFEPEESVCISTMAKKSADNTESNLFNQATASASMTSATNVAKVARFNQEVTRQRILTAALNNCENQTGSHRSQPVIIDAADSAPSTPKSASSLAGAGAQKSTACSRLPARVKLRSCTTSLQFWQRCLMLPCKLRSCSPVTSPALELKIF